MTNENIKKVKQLSPFSREFWMKKGHNEEEADYMRNSIRPIRKEYWMKRGYSEEEAIIKAKETKDSNNVKGSKASQKRDFITMREDSHRCKEYWMKRGYSEEEAIIKVSEVQSTFSLTKMIEEHGYVEGYSKWLDRQIKWQNTLNERFSGENRKILNASKNPIKMRDGESKENVIRRMRQERNMILYASVEELVESIREDLSKITIKKLMTPIDYINKFISKLQLEILEISCEKMANNIKEFFDSESRMYFVDTGKYKSWNLYTPQGLLRSSLEIYFYMQWKERGLNVEDLFIGENYPNSNFKYDFKYNEDYIEICPMYNMVREEKYTAKMDVKRKLFGCIMLTNRKEIDEYINSRSNR